MTIIVYGKIFDNIKIYRKLHGNISFYKNIFDNLNSLHEIYSITIFFVRNISNSIDFLYETLRLQQIFMEYFSLAFYRYGVEDLLQTISQKTFRFEKKKIEKL